jgi:hypothetical protein
MSSGCHLFSKGNPTARFRVTVSNTVTVTFSFQRQTLPFRMDFRIAGTQCSLSTNSHDILRVAARRHSSPQPPTTKSFHMEILVDSMLDANTAPAVHFRGLRHLVWASLPQHSFMAYDMLRKHVRGVLSSAAARDESFWNSLLLPITLGILGTTMGVVPLHCACLDREGNGLLVAGASGAGKSTLAAALARSGFAFVSDDWTYVSQEQFHLVAHGLAAPIKLLPETVQFFPELRGFEPQIALNRELAYQLDPRASLGFAVRHASQPRWIFFLERTASRGCRILPCRSEYIREFFEKSAERLPDELPHAKLARSSIIQKLCGCPAWLLRTGENPHHTAGVIDRFLSEVRHGAA